MVIRCFQQQIYQKEQHAKRQGSLTTFATIATESVFIEVVKEIEEAAKAKKAKEARQEASARRKCSARKGKLGSKVPEEMPVLSVQAPHTHQGVVLYIGTIVRALTLTMCLDLSLHLKIHVYCVDTIYYFL